MDAGRKWRETGAQFVTQGIQMFATRRRFASLISGSFAAAGLVRGVPAWAARGDDGPPNVFFSPHGRPFRAVAGAPYPVADWFKEADSNGDGKIDKAEFLADAKAFFEVLDADDDGVLGPQEIALYEHDIAPEVLGMRVTVLANGQSIVRPAEPRLWLAQYGRMEGPISQGGRQPNGLPGNPGGYSHGGDPNQGGVLPDDVAPNTPTLRDPNAGMTGAAPYGLIAEPEPVTAADPDYLFDGAVKKARFLARAESHFAVLDPERTGYLTLAGLPRSRVQAMLENHRGRG
jgi:hypothetical protein